MEKIKKPVFGKPFLGKRFWEKFGKIYFWGFVNLFLGNFWGKQKGY